MLKHLVSFRFRFFLFFFFFLTTRFPQPSGLIGVMLRPKWKIDYQVRLELGLSKGRDDVCGSFLFFFFFPFVVDRNDRLTIRHGKRRP